MLLLLYKVGVAGGDLGVRLVGMLAAIMLVGGTMALAHSLGGARAARITGVITAVMTSSVILGAVFTNNELLATVPVTFSMVALVRSRHSGRAGLWLCASGVLAACALLIKQSFGEALVAGGVYLVVSWIIRSHSGFRPTWVVWWAGGVLAPLLVTLAWFHHYSVGIKPFAYAIVGFRLDSYALMHDARQGAAFMFIHLGLPIIVVSGCLLLVPWATSWLVTHRADPQLMLPLAAWLIVGCLGIVGAAATTRTTSSSPWPRWPCCRAVRWP